MAIYSPSAESEGDGHRLNKPLLLNVHEDEFNGDFDQLKMEGIQDHPQAASSFLRTLLNGVNALSGVGILSIPYAVSEGGWLSLIFLFMVSVICFYTGVLLRRCMDVSSDIKTYPDIGEHAFGYRGRVTIAIFMYLELFLIAIEFLILEGDNMEKLFPNTCFRVLGLKIGGKQGFLLIAALVILPTMWLKNLSLLAVVSAGGILVSVILVASVILAGTIDGVGFHSKGRIINLNGIPTAISLYAFCYCGHAVFPTIYTSMKDRTQFSKVLVVCFLLCTFNYGAMAILGYLMYGEDVESQITLSLPLCKVSSKIAIYTTLLNPFTKYALLITPIANAIEDRFQINSNRAMSILVRTLLVIGTIIAALTIPFFASLMALTGSFLSCTVSIVLPCICYLKISKPHRKLEQVIIWGIVLMGVLVALMGTYTSLLQIVRHL